ncbi:response regulator transcription factor [Neosynechococcus sphagnicola]|uniref:response regulator transcription factor n=1 Tax=Neosynechococcus sphagnicola TaxID=1501145 RepID=UPI000A7522E7|nr:response regulator [Neosynechococcus sphagnicola]
MKTVLVVEDSRAEQRLIVLLLQQAGFKVSQVDSAEAAWIWLETNGRPDLIVLDVIMPGLSGLDLCRQVRAAAAYEDIPIVFCTSKDQDFDRFWALRHGGECLHH